MASFADLVRNVPIVGESLGGLASGNFNQFLEGLPIAGIGFQGLNQRLDTRKLQNEQARQFAPLRLEAAQLENRAAREGFDINDAKRAREKDLDRAQALSNILAARERTKGSPLTPEERSSIFSRIGDKFSDPEAASLFFNESGGDPSALISYFGDETQRQESVPAAIQEYQFFNRLPTDQDRENFLRVQRAPTVRTFGDVGYELNPVTGRPEQLVSPDVIADTAAQVAGSKSFATTLNKASAEGQAALPAIISSTTASLASIDDIVSNPAFDSLFGLPSFRGLTEGGLGFIPVELPGSPAADLAENMRRVLSEVRLLSFQELKGGGHITEKESEFGQQAKANLARVRSPEAARAEFNRLRQVLASAQETGVARSLLAQNGIDFETLPGTNDQKIEFARQWARQQGSISPGLPGAERSVPQGGEQRILQYNPATGRLE